MMSSLSFVPFRALGVAIGLLLCVAVAVSCSAPRLGGDEEEAPPEPPARVYHVQVLMTEEKSEAARAQSQAREWWNSQGDANRPPLVEGTSSSSRPVTIEWKVPFYRVRLGPFAERSQAQAVVESARSAFPDAGVTAARVGS